MLSLQQLDLCDFLQSFQSWQREVRDHFWRYPAGLLAGLCNMEQLLQLHVWERKVKQECKEIIK